MRYARATDDFYVPEAEDVRTQVGKPGAHSVRARRCPSSPSRRGRSCRRSTSRRSRRTSASSRRASREPARAVMPVGACTEFYWTVNARALMNFVGLRAHENAQREIRRYAEAVERFFAEKMPVTQSGLRGQRTRRPVAATQSSSRSERPSSSERA